MNGEPMLKPVVVTRAEERDGPLSMELKSLGLSVLVWAAVRVFTDRHRGSGCGAEPGGGVRLGSSSPAGTRSQP